MSEHQNVPNNLAKLEAVIDQNRKDCVVVGRNLKAIRDRELYKVFGSFEQYCQERWEISRAKVHRWITASDIRDELATFGNAIQLPTKESQYRALNDLKDINLRIKVLQHIQQTGVKQTVKTIEETAKLI